MSKERNYSQEEKEIALAYYHKCGSNAKTRRILGYPSKSCLNNWITSKGKEVKPRVVRDDCKGNASFEEKMEAIYRCLNFRAHLICGFPDLICKLLFVHVTASKVFI